MEDFFFFWKMNYFSFCPLPPPFGLICFEEELRTTVFLQNILQDCPPHVNSCSFNGHLPQVRPIRSFHESFSRPELRTLAGCSLSTRVLKCENGKLPLVYLPKQRAFDSNEKAAELWREVGSRHGQREKLDVCKRWVSVFPGSHFHPCHSLLILEKEK